MQMNDARKDELKELATSWALKNLGEDFTFRPYQLDTIINLINNILNNVKATIVESPTGSGKSIIGIITAGVLADEFDMSSYILISDTTLFSQYENDIRKYNLNWGCLAGKNNYTCLQNGKQWDDAVCQMGRGSPLKKLCEYNYTGKPPMDKEGNIETSYVQKYGNCIGRCKFLSEYNKARRMKITVMTYQYFLSTYTSIPDNFLWDVCTKKRDFVICDEAHNLANIIQTMFSPQFSMESLGYLNAIRKFVNDNFVKYPYSGLASEMDFQEAITAMENIISIHPRVSDFLSSEEISLRHNGYVVFKRLYELLETFDEFIVDALDNKITFKKEEYGVRDAVMACKQAIAVCAEYQSIIDSLGQDYCIPSIDLKVRNSYKQMVTFNCAKEPDMVREFFHSRVKNEILLSATIGNVDIYKSTIGLDTEPSVEAFEVASTFNFTNSPIYYVTDKKYHINNKNKVTILPNVVKLVEFLCNKHNGENILIQTFSYSNSMELEKSLSQKLKRKCYFHKNSQEKKEVLKMFENYRGKILVSPSLNEGWDGKGDKCRVIIVFKMPYPNMSNRLVQAKMSLYHDWYTYTAINTLVQGIGRGVRFDNDYCTTYIVDECFNSLIQTRMDFLPQAIQERLREM